MKLSQLTIDPDRIEAGDWVENIPECEDLRIRTRGLNNAEYRRLLNAKISGLPRRERRAGIAPETMRRLTTECLIEACLLDWENLTDVDGTTIPFSRERARELLFDPRYEPLRDACFYAAGVIADERDEDREDAEKNSSTA